MRNIPQPIVVASHLCASMVTESARPMPASTPRSRSEATAAPLALCTDNAAMIASAARFTEPIPYPRYLSLDAYSSR